MEKQAGASDGSDIVEPTEKSKAKLQDKKATMRSGIVATKKASGKKPKKIVTVAVKKQEVIEVEGQSSELQPKRKKVAQKEEKAKTRIRIKIAAFDNKVIDKSTRTIIEAARRSGAEVIGPIPLPTNIKKFTVLRSTFVHKDARDQYEIRTHKRLIDIYEPTPKTMETLTNLNLPAGLDLEIKM